AGRRRGVLGPRIWSQEARGGLQACWRSEAAPGGHHAPPPTVSAAWGRGGWQDRRLIAAMQCFARSAGETKRGGLVPRLLQTGCNAAAEPRRYRPATLFPQPAVACGGKAEGRPGAASERKQAWTPLRL